MGEEVMKIEDYEGRRFGEGGNVCLNLQLTSKLFHFIFFPS